MALKGQSIFEGKDAGVKTFQLQGKKAGSYIVDCLQGAQSEELWVPRGAPISNKNLKSVNNLNKLGEDCTSHKDLQLH